MADNVEVKSGNLFADASGIEMTHFSFNIVNEFVQPNLTRKLNFM